ncbi:hypothetical protein [Cupriavidus necator]
MTKVTITPSQEIVAAAATEVIVDDARGRKLTLKKPGLLAQFRLTEAMGPDAAENGAYRAMCMPLMWVVAIDGERVNLPTSKLEIEALIQRLEDDGFLAINMGIEKHFRDNSRQSVESAKN